MQVWTGYSQSLRAGDGVLTLNVDMACTAFLEQDPVLKFLMKAAGVANEGGLSNMASMQLRKAQKAIAGLKASLPFQPSTSYVDGDSELFLHFRGRIFMQGLRVQGGGGKNFTAGLKVCTCRECSFEMTTLPNTCFGANEGVYREGWQVYSYIRSSYLWRSIQQGKFHHSCGSQWVVKPKQNSAEAVDVPAGGGDPHGQQEARVQGQDPDGARGRRPDVRE